MIKVKKSADFDKLFDAFNEEVAKNRLNGVGYRFSKPKLEKDVKIEKKASTSGDDGAESGSTQSDQAPKPEGVVSSSDDEMNINKAPSDQAVIDEEEEGNLSGQDGVPSEKDGVPSEKGGVPSEKGADSDHSQKDGDEGDDEGDQEQAKLEKIEEQKSNSSLDEDEEAKLQDHDEGVQANIIDLTNQE